MSAGENRTWFETLRRDRGLFAVVGCFVLLLNIVQPLAASQAGEGGRWVICTVYGAEEPVDPSDLPAAGLEHCPICLGGNSCAKAPLYKAALSILPAFPAPEVLAAAVPPVRDAVPPPRRAVDPPTAIRAPPFPV